MAEMLNNQKKKCRFYNEKLERFLIVNFEEV